MTLGGQARDFTFFVETGQLMSRMQGQDAVPVIPYGNDTFGVGFDPSVRIVFTMSDGRAAKVTLRQGGATYEGTRK